MIVERPQDTAEQYTPLTVSIPISKAILVAAPMSFQQLHKRRPRTSEVLQPSHQSHSTLTHQLLVSATLLKLSQHLHTGVPALLFLRSQVLLLLHLAGQTLQFLRHAFLIRLNLFV